MRLVAESTGGGTPLTGLRKNLSRPPRRCMPMPPPRPSAVFSPPPSGLGILRGEVLDVAVGLIDLQERGHQRQGLGGRRPPPSQPRGGGLRGGGGNGKAQVGIEEGRKGEVLWALPGNATPSLLPQK